MKTAFIHQIQHRQWPRHLLFWAAAGLVLLRIFGPEAPFASLNLIYTMAFLVTLTIPVYLNLGWLIPRLLKEQRYVPYFLSLSFFLLAGAGFNMLLFGKLIDYLLPGYYFVSYYDYAEVLVFFIALTGLTTLLKLSEGWFSLMETQSRIMGLEKEVVLGELNALRSQVQPHFFFNCLNSIYALARKRSDRTAEAVLQLSDFMRYVIYETGGGTNPLEQEILMIRQYLDLQRMRTDDPSGITFSVNGDAGSRRIAPLLFLPLLENSFKHGGNGNSGLPAVEAWLDITGSRILFRISNPYDLPASSLPVKEPSGVGLSNLRRRLELLYPESRDFRIIRENGIFTVILEIRTDETIKMPDHRG